MHVQLHVRNSRIFIDSLLLARHLQLLSHSFAMFPFVLLTTPYLVYEFLSSHATPDVVLPTCNTNTLATYFTELSGIIRGELL